MRPIGYKVPTPLDEKHPPHYLFLVDAAAVVPQFPCIIFQIEIH